MVDVWLSLSWSPPAKEESGWLAEREREGKPLLKRASGEGLLFGLLLLFVTEKSVKCCRALAAKFRMLPLARRAMCKAPWWKLGELVVRCLTTRALALGSRRPGERLDEAIIGPLLLSS